MKINKSLKLPNISLPFINNHFSRKPLNIYFINSLKNFRIKKENSRNNSITKKNSKSKSIKTQSISVLNMSKKRTIDAKKHYKNKKKLKIIPNFSFKNIFEVIKKNNLKKSASYNNINTIDKEKLDFESNFMKLRKEANIYNNINTIDKEKLDFESNFMKLRKEANIYTSNANYIKNTKMLLLDKYIYDNNKYKPDRLGLFDMSDFNNLKFKEKKAITGHIYYNHNKYQRNVDNDSKY